MKEIILCVLTAATAYSLGSVSSALVVCRLMRIEDIRTKGSGNAGTSNMIRTYGKKAGLLTGLGDLLKAVVAVLVSYGLAMIFDVALPFPIGYFAGLFVLIGHVFPVFFGFRGGKAVMPAVGVVLAIDPITFGILLVVAGFVFLLGRKMSVVSLVSAAILPPVTALTCRVLQKNCLFPLVFVLCYSVLVVIAHRSNILRLVRGEEPILDRSEDKNEGSDSSKD